ncbi:hypothetical protein ROJ8625_04025 [Roseivivax jejudonensis]|uniref:Exopolysaccharide biosynthesis protein YbjH n=1 Tax=Roseivivax jejudonensis TaxID=1529041 RepID=A0A1X7AAE3_9RHOB|nr:YjbH domain-containing protein [Roseivivax jejudonensis]SLN74214.1 hypothetical protein ROJ8625_04025 [Roseivivax jejudonensis]
MYRRATVAACLCSCALASGAEPLVETRLNSFGMPGLIDMPAAPGRPDGELGFTTSYFKNTLRNTLSFQVTPRLSGAFRYSNLYDIRSNPDSDRVQEFIFDRSFSLHYQLGYETETMPALAVGLNDFLGTGRYRSEYIVATKHLGNRLRVTGGIGWGRLGLVNGFRNPLSYIASDLEDRPDRDGNEGGQVELDQLFSGPTAIFGGLEYQATDRLRYTLEYSSDNYPFEGETAFDYQVPINIGATYTLRPGVDISLRYLYGSEIGIQTSFALNPKNPRSTSGLDRAPPAVAVRADAGDLGWDQGGTRAARAEVIERTELAMDAEGVDLIGLDLSGTRVRAEVQNETYLQQAQAVGRASRVLTRTMPPSVDIFEIVLVQNGIPLSRVTLDRGDLETLETDFDNSWSSYARADIDATAEPVDPIPEAYPRLSFGLTPYIAPSLFDPDAPFRADVGAQLAATYEPTAGLVFRGQVRKKVFGNLDESTRESDSVLPRVRSEFNRYDRNADPRLTQLTGSYFFRPGEDLYGRVSAGYLEPFFGGVSAELLWKPVDSKLGFGIEANYVKQRDFEMLFDFRDYEVGTGHVSAYYDFDNAFRGQVDVGKYLAGDWGTTLTLEREFENGWKVGGFATFTEVSADEFGEGSFDKGITLTIPIGWVSGQPTKDTFSTAIRPVQRDGGARLDVADRLYPLVRDSHETELEDGWGRFWR